jgi:hypothetical protein
VLDPQNRVSEYFVREIESDLFFRRPIRRDIGMRLLAQRAEREFYFVVRRIRIRFQYFVAIEQGYVRHWGGVYSKEEKMLIKLSL